MSVRLLRYCLFLLKCKDKRNPLDLWSKACPDFGADSRNPLGCAFNDLRNPLGCAFNDSRNPLGCAFNDSRNPLGCAFNDSRNQEDSWSIMRGQRVSRYPLKRASRCSKLFLIPLGCEK